MPERDLSAPSTESTLPPSGADASDTSARDRLVIALLLTSAFVDILNETIMGVALPRLMDDLDITASVGQWLTTAFMLTVAVVIPITGFLLRRYTTRTVFLAAMGLFSTGTLISALAPGFAVLLVGRVVQASGTAVMMPLLMTTIMTLVPAARRGRTMGNISIVMSVAPALGPTISGLILTFFDWRWMFLFVLPIAIGALLLGAARIVNVTETTRARIDVLSVVLSAFAFAGLIYGLSSIAEASRGHAIVPPWIPLVVGTLALTAFVLRQLGLQRDDRALLDMRVFQTRNFTVPMLVMGIAMASMFGTLIILPIYLQSVLGLEPLTTGLCLLPGSLLMGLLGPVVGRVYDRRGPAPLLIPGTVAVSAALWLMSSFSGSTPVPVVVLSHVVISAGFALMFTPLFTTALGSLRPQLYSFGSAVVGTGQQVAGAAGTALLITVLTVVTASAVRSGHSAATAEIAGVHAAFLAAAVVSLGPIVLGFLVRRPATTDTDALRP
jgi:DHA2 family lincomycin resistance protein-like MFS transporter